MRFLCINNNQFTIHNQVFLVVKNLNSKYSFDMIKIKYFIFVLLAIFLIIGCESTQSKDSNENPNATLEPTKTEQRTDFSEDSKDQQTHDSTSGSEHSLPKLKPASEEELLGSWWLFTMEDKDASFPISSEVTIIFDKDAEVSGLAFFGMAAVNSYFGAAKIDGTMFVPSEIGSTKMAGIEEDMETENNYLRLLNTVNQIGFFYAESGTLQELILQNAQTGTKLVFVR